MDLLCTVDTLFKERKIKSVAINTSRIEIIANGNQIGEL